MSGDFDKLLEKWRADEITADETVELERLLEADPERRRRFRRVAGFDAVLREWAAEGRSNKAPAESGFQRWWAGHPAMILATAAVLMLAAVLGAFLLGGRGGEVEPAPVAVEEPESSGFAVLTQVSGARFGEGFHGAPGDTLSAGVIELLGGMAQVEFFCGSTVILEGPAVLEIRSEWEAFCRSGRLRVRVPPPARGFRMLTPEMTLVDLGTEFGVKVDAGSGSSEVHVFDGEVEAHVDGDVSRIEGGAALRRVRGGEAVRAEADPGVFSGVREIGERSELRARERFGAWSAWRDTWKADPRMIAFYDFQRPRESGWGRLLPNAGGESDLGGGIVGASWTHGRWPGKDALEFKRPGDRVRIDFSDEPFERLTMMCWVRIDGLDRRYNALLLTDNYQFGKPHWQIYEDGRLMFSIMYPGPDGKTGRNQMYFSPKVFDLENLGRWRHLAVTYDNHRGEVVQYVDGVEIHREVSEFHAPGRPVRLDPAGMGNYGLNGSHPHFPIRNLNGRMDEFSVLREVLDGEEIKACHEVGKPE